ncbi:sugar ABC transporter substrate-binding protein [Bombiscardovia nodaiensis]|uniref:Sugar ABC transporter substrate-binding protein n=1 Tax=Bombiscardovia nodaiensis TaxID=2932181 RepID=A0ABM8B8M0_9BIFI|nr:sugar ABC transporter substrate-binding protein [Bombiscardovia nodaiensis]
MQFKTLGRLTAASAAIIMGLAGLSACGSSSSGGASADSGSKASDVEAALKKGGSLTYWTWTNAAEPQVAAFEKAYPNVHVKVVNPGSGASAYTKMMNAIKADKDVPDIMQIEYQALSQFYTPGNLLDLAPYGFTSLKSQYASSAWSSVAVDGKIYGLPQDTGPMALFYNKKVFDSFGISEPPKTWDEFIKDGEIMQQKDPSVHITSDSGQGNLVTSLLWQAGSHAFKVDGTNVTINLKDKGATQWAKTWDKLISEHLITTFANQGTEWYQAANKGKMASIISASWLRGSLEGSVKESAGDWRVAPLPTYDGKPASANYGGSSQAAYAKTKNPALAAGFIKWLNSSKESIEIAKQKGTFPSTVKELNATEFLEEKPDYFGGQQINKVFNQSSKDILPKWQFLPYQVYANSIVNDTIGKAYEGSTTFESALQNFQKDLVKYGNEQGYTVKEG